MTQGDAPDRILEEVRNKFKLYGFRFAASDVSIMDGSEEGNGILHRRQVLHSFKGSLRGSR